MVTDTLNQLKDMLSPLKIYNVDDNTVVNAELCAYAYGIDLVKVQIQKVLKEGFVQTAQDFGLSLREGAMAIAPKGTQEQRRYKIIKRFCTVRGEWDMQKIINSVEQMGLEVEIIEEFEENRIIISFPSQENATLDNLSKIFRAIYPDIPAHLEVRSNLAPMTWDDFDNIGKKFIELDRLGLSFDSVESFL